MASRASSGNSYSVQGRSSDNERVQLGIIVEIPGDDFVARSNNASLGGSISDKALLASSTPVLWYTQLFSLVCFWMRSAIPAADENMSPVLASNTLSMSFLAVEPMPSAGPFPRPDSKYVQVKAMPFARALPTNKATTFWLRYWLLGESDEMVILRPPSLP